MASASDRQCHVDNVPAVGFRLRGVIYEPAFNVTIDRDTVVIIERTRSVCPVSEYQPERAHFVSMPSIMLVAHKDVGEVVNDVVARFAKLRRQSFGNRHLTALVTLRPSGPVVVSTPAV